MSENRLLDAVDALTKRRTVVNWIGDGERRRMVSRQDDALLDLLADAVASNLGGHGSGRPARERVPVDFAALALLERISDTVRAWVGSLGGKAGRDVGPSSLLRSWYVLYMSAPRPVGEGDRFAASVEGWRSQVEGILDPPTVLEITAPCPGCGESWAFDPSTGDRVVALVASMRESLDDASVQCRFCVRVWAGRYGARLVRRLIDEAEELRNAG